MPPIGGWKTGVYCIRNTMDGKRYVGGAYVDFNKRWKDHLDLLKAGKHHSRHLQSAWIKYGRDKFKFEVIERCSPEKTQEREQHYLDFYRVTDPKKGYNFCPTAKTWLGANHSEKTRSKISGIWRRPGYRENVSARSKEAAKAQWADPENRKRMSEIKKAQYENNNELKSRLSISTKKVWEGYTEEQRRATIANLHTNGEHRGESHGQAVLTESKVREARRLRAEGWTYKRLRDHFGCGLITIYKAVVGATWRHVK